MGTTIMCENTPVLHFDLDSVEYDIITPELLPFQLKGKLRDMPNVSAANMDNVSEIMRQTRIADRANNTAITSYFASRVLPITRENAKKLYNLFGFEQLQTDHAKALIAIECRGVSLQDNYWIRDDREKDITWKDVNLRHASLSEIVAQVALHGSSLTLQGNEKTPELNGQGAYAKAWKRENNELYLYKLGSNGQDRESQIEVMVSHILDKTNVRHVIYEDGESMGRYACKCKCMTTDDLSILSAMDYHSYCNVNGIDFDKSIMNIDADGIYKMWIVDYLISNSDRHGMNWGFFYDASSMDILKTHPLFDHNNAFDKELMKDKDAPYVFDRRFTMKQAAQIAMRHTDFHLTEPIYRDDFLSQEQYDSFIDRANDIGLDLDKIIQQE